MILIFYSKIYDKVSIFANFCQLNICNYYLSQPTFLVALFYGEFKPLNVDSYLIKRFTE